MPCRLISRESPAAKLCTLKPGGLRSECSRRASSNYFVSFQNVWEVDELGLRCEASSPLSEITLIQPTWVAQLCNMHSLNQAGFSAVWHFFWVPSCFITVHYVISCTRLPQAPFCLTYLNHSRWTMYYWGLIVVFKCKFSHRWLLEPPYAVTQSHAWQRRC